MHVTAGVTFTQVCQLLNERQDGASHQLRLNLQFLHVEVFELCRALDLDSGCSRDHSQARLHPRQGDFDVEVALQQSLVREDAAHRRRAEHVLEKR